jgi:ferredoxin-NADP reductase
MPMPIRNFRIVDRRQETGDVIVLQLEPADTEPMFAFKAGQFISLHIFNDDGSEWGKSFYSIATAPSESSERFLLAIKVRGDFTQRASQLRAGDLVGIQGPFGAFVLRNEIEPLVMFAGGIGITPLRSMLREALVAQKDREIFLFYSDKTRESMAFLKEFRDLQGKHANFHPIFILTNEKPLDWDGETCRLNSEMVSSRIKNMADARYCMCGPKGFMECVREILVSCSVDVKTRLKQELF